MTSHPDPPMRSRRPRSLSHRLRLDSLEARVTPAGDITAVVTNAGDLKLTGDNLDNAVEVFTSTNGNNVPVWVVIGQSGTTINGDTFAEFLFPAAGFRNVTINTKNVATGGDSVLLNGLTHTGNLKISGGTGADSFVLFNHVAGKSVTIATKGGDNAVNVIGTPGGTNAAPTATTTVGKNLTITGTTGADSFGVVGATVAGNFKATASKGANYIALSEVAVTGKTTVVTSKDADAIHFGLTAANGDALSDTAFGNVLLGKVALNLGAGNDDVIVQNVRFGSMLTAKLAAGDDRFLESGNDFLADALTAYGKTRAGGGGSDLLYTDATLDAAQVAKLQFEAVNDGNEDDLFADVLARLTGPVRVNFETQGINLDGDSADTIAEALVLGDPVNAPVTGGGQILGAGKGVILYSFNGVLGDRYAIDIDNLTGNLDSFLRVFNSAGVELADNDDNPAPGESFSLESYIEFTLPSTGTFYVGVSSLGNTGYNPVDGTGDTFFTNATGGYDLAISHLGDGRTSNATALSAPTDTISTVSSIVGGRGVVMWSLPLTAGHTLKLDVDAEAGLSDSYLRLFDAMGNEVASDDDTAGPGAEFDNNESYLEYTVPASGTYFIGVSVYSNIGYNAVTGTGDTDPFRAGGGFTLDVSVNYNGIAPTDQISEAIDFGDVVDDAATADGTIGDNGRTVVMYAFTGERHDYYDIDIDNLTGGLDSLIRVFDVNGVQLTASDDDAAPGEVFSLESYLRFQLPASGTYYVGVSSLSNGGYNPVDGTGDFAGGSQGTYTITISNAGDGAINDNFVDLGDPFDNPFNVSGTVGGRGVLMWSVDLVDGDQLNIDLDSLGLGDSILRLFDENGNQVAFSDDTTGPGVENSGLESFIQYDVTVTGRYYIGVSAYDNGGYNGLTGTGDSFDSSVDGGDFTMDIFLT